MKPLSREELIEKAKKLRDELMDVLPESMKISDEQIEKNVSKKYGFYSDAFKFSTGKYEKLNEFNEYAKENKQKNYCAFRGGEAQGLTREQFSSRLDEVNTPEKAEHFQRKSLEKLVKADYKEMIEVLNDTSKLMQYSKTHSDLIYQGFTATGLTKCTQLSESNNKLINSNTKIFESLSATMLNKIMFNANPLSMLFEGYEHNLDQMEAFTIVAFAKQKGVIDARKEAAIEDVMLCDTFDALASSMVDDYVPKLYETLKKNDIKDLSLFKPEKEGQSLQDALIHGDNLVKKSDEEIKEMNDDFNKYEDVVLDQRMDDKAHSKMLSKEELARYFKNHNMYVAEEKMDSHYEDYKETIIRDTLESKQAEKQKEIDDLNNSYIDRAVKAKTEYEKMSGFSKFFSHLVPNSWTKAGRLRDEISETMSFIETRELTEQFNSAYNEAKGIKDVVQEDPRDHDIRFDGPKPEAARTQLDLSESIKEAPNSSKENFEKENELAAQMTNEKENTFDGFEVMDESQFK